MSRKPFKKEDPSQESPQRSVSRELLAQLATDVESSDSILDFLLFDVPNPDGLSARLKSIPHDASLDEALCAVQLPEGLLGNLRSIPEVATIEEELCSVPVPSHLPKALKTIPNTAPPVVVSLNDASERLSNHAVSSDMQWGRFAIAALLLITVTLASWAVFRNPDNPNSTLVEGNPPSSVPPENGTSIALSQPDDRSSSHQGTEDSPGTPSVGTPPWYVIANLLNANQFDPTLPLEQFSSEWGSALENLQIELANAAKANAEENLTLHAMPGNMASPPTVSVVEGITNRGAKLPRSRDFNLQEFFRTGMHPFVNPSAHDDLETVAVPLVRDTASYVSARDSLLRRKVPDAKSIRPEEFLAAMPALVDFTPPADPAEKGANAKVEQAPASPLVVDMAGVHAPWLGRNRFLLRVGVATPPVNTKDRANSLIVLMDPSARKAGIDCASFTQEAVQKLLAELEPQRSLHLIIAGDSPKHFELHRRGTNVPEENAALLAIQYEATCNLTKGFEAANAILRTQEKSQQYHRVVLITSSEGPMRPSEIAVLSSTLSDLTNLHARCDVLRFGEVPSDVALTESIAQLGGGTVINVTSQNDMDLALATSTPGREPLAAEFVEMEVRFNPDMVRRYRLIGFEPSAGGGLFSDDSKRNLEFGASAFALFDVELASHKASPVATAKVAWRDPAAEAFQKSIQVISGDVFVTRFSNASAGLQVAAIAVTTAELLRGSPHLPDRVTPKMVLSLFQQVDPVLLKNRSVFEIREMLQRLDAMSFRNKSDVKSSLKAILR